MGGGAATFLETRTFCWACSAAGTSPISTPALTRTHAREVAQCFIPCLLVSSLLSPSRSARGADVRISGGQPLCHRRGQSKCAENLGSRVDDPRGVRRRDPGQGRPRLDRRGYFVDRVELFVKLWKYAEMSASSWPLSVGSLMPAFCARSSISRLWFHIAAISGAGAPTTLDFAKSPAVFPPLPPTAWQAVQPLACTSCWPRARSPAAGSK